MTVFPGFTGRVVIFDGRAHEILMAWVALGDAEDVMVYRLRRIGSDDVQVVPARCCTWVADDRTPATRGPGTSACT